MDNLITNRVKKFLHNKRATLLGVGPMSLNCVDAVIELSNTYEAPILLIASRRQIDSDEFGGGYVNNWTTKDFARYVINNDKKGNILLARDHGGPWQNTKEVNDNLSLRDAMASAKLSYKNDIDAGFDVLHIDPSIDIHHQPDVDEVLQRVFDLYQYCWSYAKSKGKDIIFEIGTEEQSGSTNSQEELIYTLDAMENFCKINNLPFPSFVVVQCGTRVMETRNVGSFDSPVRVLNEIPSEIQLPKMLEICNKYGIFMKEHNTDYLSDEGLKWHPKLGIHSANVAPEFGVCESRSLVEILENNGLKKLAEEFLRIAFDSNKWDKWMIEGTSATDRDKAIIAGHYVFSNKDFLQVKTKAEEKLRKKSINLNDFLKNRVKASIMRYLKHFRMVID